MKTILLIVLLAFSNLAYSSVKSFTPEEVEGMYLVLVNESKKMGTLPEDIEFLMWRIFTCPDRTGTYSRPSHLAVLHQPTGRFMFVSKENYLKQFGESFPDVDIDTAKSRAMNVPFLNKCIKDVSA